MEDATLENRGRLLRNAERQRAYNVHPSPPPDNARKRDMKRVRAAGSLLLITAAAACAAASDVPPGHAGPGLPPPPDRPRNIAFVHGFVVDPAGARVAGAEVWLAWAPASGPDARCLLVPSNRAARVHTDGAGYFSATLEGSFGPEYTGCLDVLAGDHSGRPLATKRELRVRFRSAAPAPRDTLRVDVQLSDRPG
jgi:hypothetical protein